MIAIFGDSIAVGHIDDQGGWPARLQAYFGKLFLSGKIDDTQSVHNFSVSGETSEWILPRALYELDNVSWDDPRIVIVSLGTNDSAWLMNENRHQVPLESFQKNIQTILDKALEYEPTKLCLLTCPRVNDDLVFPMPWDPERGYKTEFIETYNQAIKEIAASYNSHLIDVFELIEEKDLVDGVHPGPPGHEKIFKAVLKMIEPILYPDLK